MTDKKEDRSDNEPNTKISEIRQNYLGTKRDGVESKPYSLADKISTLGRRNFLSALTGLGVSSSSLNYLTKDSIVKATSDLKKEVPYVEKIQIKNPGEYQNELPDEPLPTTEVVETISRERWALVESAHDAAKQVQTLLNQRFDAGLSATVQSSSPTDHQVLVQLSSFNYINTNTNEENTVKEQVGHPEITEEQLHEILPKEVTGVAGARTEMETTRKVPVSIESVQKELVNKYTSSYRPVPGGCQQHAYPDYDPDYTLGTMTAPFYSNDTSGRQMVTAGHNFSLHTNNKNYKNVHQPGKDYAGDNRVGDRHDHEFTYETNNTGQLTDVHHDAGVWEPESEISLTYDLAKDGGGTRTSVSGIITWDTIKNKSGDESYTITKQGAATGTKSGYIDNIDSNDRRFETTADASGGDSGGPFYHIDSDTGYALVAGVVSVAADGGNRSGGNDIQWVMDKFDLQI